MKLKIVILLLTSASAWAATPQIPQKAPQKAAKSQSRFFLLPAEVTGMGSIPFCIKCFSRFANRKGLAVLTDGFRCHRRQATCD